MRVMAIFAASLLALSAPAVANPDKMTAADESAVQQAMDRGALIYAYDQAAWHGTDDLRAKVADLRAVTGGWIVDGDAANPELVFIDKNLTDPHAIYVADFRDNKLISSKLLSQSDDTTLSPARKRLIAAREVAWTALVASGQPRCVDQPFNTVILPPKGTNAPTLVYFLTPQPDNNTIPFGGHYMIEVSPDGKAGPVRAFAKSCALFPLRDKDKSLPEALTITHLINPTPTEIHVFASLAAHLPVYVVTAQNDRVWAVEGSRVRLVDQSKTK